MGTNELCDRCGLRPSDIETTDEGTYCSSCFDEKFGNRTCQIKQEMSQE